jgi:hypothetical protein
LLQHLLQLWQRLQLRRLLHAQRLRLLHAQRLVQQRIQRRKQLQEQLALLSLKQLMR